MVEALAIVGGTAKQFGLDIKETSSLVNAFVSLEKIDKQERSQILLKLFGQEYQDDIALIVGSLEEYKKAIGFVADKEKYNKSMQKEFNNHASTTANNLQLLKNTIAELGLNLGSVMLPPLKWISNVLRGITNPIAWLAEKFPVITIGIMSIISALIIGYFAWNTSARVLTLLSARVIPAVIMGLKALTLAVVTNPIGATVAGLSVGAALVIANWQKVKDFSSSIWKSITKPKENWIGIENCLIIQ
ncbi:phage tail tape measure protein [Trichonephila inaurata madagascariensis]|uniref:Phage tail tape measure protein n=1 Tax=Trichonephila inaurata madagascariensis TaxID=2747483 RepID=A0A8X6WTC3_9ARAC|nr:phage tail tape measure protein [Trichonephila inaurata madagascariensis]